MTQLMMAGPLLALYEISIWVAKIFGKKPNVEAEEDDETVPVPADGPSPPTDKKAPSKNESGETDAPLSPEEEVEESDKA